METTRKAYENIMRMSSELEAMQRGFIMAMLRENGDRIEVDREGPHFKSDAHLQAETFDGEEMVAVDYIRLDGDRMYWGGTVYDGDPYEDEIFPSDYDEIIRGFMPNFIK